MSVYSFVPQVNKYWLENKGAATLKLKPTHQTGHVKVTAPYLT